MLEQIFAIKQSLVEQQVDVLTDLKALLSQGVSGGAISTFQEKIVALLTAMDRALSVQLNAILHHAEFQQLESAWRGLDYLVRHTKTEDDLKIKVLNLSKTELHESVVDTTNSDWERSVLFTKIYQEVYEVPGVEPFSCLIGDYYFGNSPQEVQTLEHLAKIGAVSHAPFLAGAAPTAWGLESWQELSNPRDLTNFLKSPGAIAWRRLRKLPEARFVGLTMPRFLGRLPYGHISAPLARLVDLGLTSIPVAEFDFEEIDYDYRDQSTWSRKVYFDQFTWCNSVYLMAANINRAFTLFGCCSHIRGIESGGAIEGLPTMVSLRVDSGLARNCPLEIALDERCESDLSFMGLMLLIQKKDANFVAFLSANSLHKPAEYDDPDLTAELQLAARFPHLLPACRFGQYLQCMARDNASRYRNRQHLQEALQRWILGYVDEFPYFAKENRARKPLTGAEIVILEIEDQSYEVAKCVFKPFYQLEGLEVPVHLTLRLPKATKDGRCRTGGMRY